MLTNSADRLVGHLTRCDRLGWPVTRNLRAAVRRTLRLRGWHLRNHEAAAGVLSLALVVSSLPARDIDSAGALLTANGGA